MRAQCSHYSLFAGRGEISPSLQNAAATCVAAPYSSVDPRPVTLGWHSITPFIPREWRRERDSNPRFESHPL